AFDRQMQDCGWGIADVRFPRLDEAERDNIERDLSQLEKTPPETGDAAPTIPLLLAAVPLELDAPARAMTAAQIGDLGSAIYAADEEKVTFMQRWQRKVLHDAPARIEPILVKCNETLPGKVGDIVHKALRWWKFSTE